MKYVNYLVYVLAVTMFCLFFLIPILFTDNSENLRNSIGVSYAKYIMDEYPQKGQNFADVFNHLFLWRHLNKDKRGGERKPLFFDKIKRIIGEPDEIKGDNLRYKVYDKICLFNNKPITNYVLRVNQDNELVEIVSCDDEHMQQLMNR